MITPRHWWVGEDLLEWRGLVAEKFYDGPFFRFPCGQDDVGYRKLASVVRATTGKSLEEIYPYEPCGTWRNLQIIGGQVIERRPFRITR